LFVTPGGHRDGVRAMLASQLADISNSDLFDCRHDLAARLFNWVRNYLGVLTGS
jgi:hypothetical protein